MPDSTGCYCDHVTILVTTIAGDPASRAGIVAALAGLAGAARCRQHDTAGDRPAAWLEAAGQAGGTPVKITTPLAVRAVPGGTLAAGPGGLPRTSTRCRGTGTPRN